MTQFHEWEWFTGNQPNGRVQVWCDGETREKAEKGNGAMARAFIWNRSIIAFRRVKEPVRGEMVLYARDYGIGSYGASTSHEPRDTHRLTLPTDDGALICGEYVGPGGAVVKVEMLG